MKRIGIDVGGTNTDLVLLEGNEVVQSFKTITTSDVTSGIRNTLLEIVRSAKSDLGEIDAVMIGTTHFVNAIVQRQNLNRVGALRICLPSCGSLPPFVDWPKDLVEQVSGEVCLVAGGHEYDGRELVPLDEKAIETAALAMRSKGIRSMAISAVFSPLTSGHEERAAKIMRDVHPELQITLSSTLGRIGLLERENAALLNAALVDLADQTFSAFKNALDEFELSAPLFITQNDGTVVSVERAKDYPILCLASGPTNSMRGAAFLSGLSDAMVCDIGGTTTDVGNLRGGFPRQANNVVEVGGVRTLFRMPDLISIGLGGGTTVKENPFTLGPQSVGYKLRQKALVFGGDTLTLTDVAVASGWIKLGKATFVKNLSSRFLDSVKTEIFKRLYETIDSMKIDATPLPLIVVGGGSMLAPETMGGISEVVHVQHNEVANAVGAAIAQVSGEIDRIYRDLSRQDAIALAEKEARAKAVSAGADNESLIIVELEDLPLAYLPGNALRIRIRLVGDIKQNQAEA